MCRVPRGEVAFTPTEAAEIARRLGGGTVVVKAQIHAGGRGKAGGVKLAKNVDEAETHRPRPDRHDARDAPDRPEGRVVSRVLVEEGLAIDARAVPRASCSTAPRAVRS